MDRVTTPPAGAAHIALPAPKAGPPASDAGLPAAPRREHEPTAAPPLAGRGEEEGMMMMRGRGAGLEREEEGMRARGASVTGGVTGGVGMARHPPVTESPFAALERERESLGREEAGSEARRALPARESEAGMMGTGAMGSEAGIATTEREAAAAPMGVGAGDVMGGRELRGAEGEEVVCGRKEFVQVEDRPVVIERVER
jgi:hypothetical protein